jgi:hypothetical protein
VVDASGILLGVGVWRSLVAHLNGVQEVPRSNRGTPTTFLSTEEALRGVPEGLVIRAVPPPIPQLSFSASAAAEGSVHAVGGPAEHLAGEVGIDVGGR